MKPENKDRLKLSTYFIDIFLLITLFTALVDKISPKYAIECSILYVITKVLIALGQDVYKRYGECRLMKVLRVLAVIAIVVSVFVIWSVGIASITHLISFK